MRVLWCEKLPCKSCLPPCLHSPLKSVKKSAFLAEQVYANAFFFKLLLCSQSDPCDVICTLGQVIGNVLWLTLDLSDGGISPKNKCIQTCRLLHTVWLFMLSYWEAAQCHHFSSILTLQVCIEKPLPGLCFSKLNLFRGAIHCTELVSAVFICVNAFVLL